MIYRIKLWWHCLRNGHGVVTITHWFQDIDKKISVHFCECGYGHPQGKNWAAVVKEAGLTTKLPEGTPDNVRPIR